jgi:ABC-type glycerol-3-phosphate transport system substrate-binding protein
MRFKLGLILTLACALALGIAGCGGSDDGGSSSASSSETSAAKKPSEVSGTVTVWDLASGNFAGYDPVNEELIAEFEAKYPKVTVDHVPQPFEGFEPIYKAAFAAHEGPDVMMMLTAAAGALSYTQGLEVLNDRITPEMQEEITNWGTATPGFSEEGDHYGVPIGSNGQIFYYNKELFEKAGLPREFQPKTWDELREAGEKLKAAGILPFTGGDKEGYENGWWFGAGWQTENTTQEAVELAEGEIPYTDELVAKAFEPEIMLQEAGLFNDDRFTTPLFPDGGKRFANEEAAMVYGPQALIGYYGEYNPKLGEKNVGMFLPPGSKFLGTENEFAWSIPTFAKNKDAAWAFIEFMSSKESIAKFVDAEVMLPNRKDVHLPADAPEQARQLVKWKEELPVFPTVHSVVPATMLFGPFATEINAVLQGRTSLEEAQQVMQETAEKTAH